MGTEPEYVNVKEGEGVACRFYRPASTPIGTVVVASAMGVNQPYYAAFASWLANNGYLAITFDYRGTGDSRVASLRGVDLDLFDWVEDCSDVLATATDASGGSPVYWVGHSLGGQLAPLVDGINAVSKVITVASGSGYWLENAWPTKRRAWWLWFFVVPLVTPLIGYFPGRKLRKVGDLPKGVMLQWRRWCLDRDYLVGSEDPWVRARFASVTAPVVSLSFADDEMMSKRNIASLHGFLSGAPVKMARIEPSDVGVPKIGHFGFFRKSLATVLWDQQIIPELSCA